MILQEFFLLLKKIACGNKICKIAHMKRKERKKDSLFLLVGG
jgi:hypothetical protein